MSNRSEMTTKERIFDAAEDLMLAKSFHSVGLNEILTAVNVPKGSFYHHFESKEQFGTEMLRHYVTGATQHKTAWLLDRTQYPDAMERLIAYLDACVAKFVENECKPVCLVVKLCGEVATFSDGMRQELANGFQQWGKVFEQLIREGQQQKSISPKLIPAKTAMLICDVWLGAMLRALVVKHVTPLREACAYLKTYMRA
jgi:TetR/AcrR family transcriptional regulator, transcriptional repressor for nem operon